MSLHKSLGVTVKKIRNDIILVCYQITDQSGWKLGLACQSATSASSMPIAAIIGAQNINEAAKRLMRISSPQGAIDFAGAIELARIVTTKPA